MVITQKNDLTYTVTNDGIDLFSFTTFKTPELLPSDYCNYETFLSDLAVYFVDAVDGGDMGGNSYNCICAEPITYDENITIEQWSEALKLIYDKFQSDYSKIYFKLMVIGNKFSYVCARVGLEYVTNVFTEFFDEEYGMKNQEFLIYVK